MRVRMLSPIAELQFGEPRYLYSELRSGGRQACLLRDLRG